MGSSLLLSISTFIYGLSAFMQIAALVFRRRIFFLLGKCFAYFGISILTFGILFRWYESYDLGIGHVPLSNLYESLIFFAWILVLAYLVFEIKYKDTFVGFFVIPIAFLFIAYASLSPNIKDTIQPLVPALQSNWLIIHVLTCFIGYASFAISFGLSVLYLFGRRFYIKFSYALLGKNYNFGKLKYLNYQMVVFGFLFLSIGIITGAVWANSAWGSYWSWDPKETWSLITWFVYAIFIHISLVKNWGGSKAAYVSMIGFLSVLFTYFGVNYLHGLHSYTTM